MNLFEMFDAAPDGYQDLEDDNSTLGFDDLRKSRLTLMQINKLRRMQDLRAYEKEEKLTRVKRQYSQNDAGGDSPLEI